MLKEGELQETNSQSEGASVDAREDAVQSLHVAQTQLDTHAHRREI